MQPWTPERRARHSVLMKAREKDPVYQAKVKASREVCLAKGREFSTERRARQAAQMLAQVQTPEFQIKQLQGELRTARALNRKRKRPLAPQWCPPMLGPLYKKLRLALGPSKAKSEILDLMDKDRKMWPFKRKNPLAVIERIEAFNLEPGDVLLLTMPENYPATMMNEARTMLQRYLGPTPFKIIVAQAGTKLSVARNVPSAMFAQPGALTPSE